MHASPTDRPSRLLVGRRPGPGPGPRALGWASLLLMGAVPVAGQGPYSPWGGRPDPRTLWDEPAPRGATVAAGRPTSRRMGSGVPVHCTDGSCVVEPAPPVPAWPTAAGPTMTYPAVGPTHLIDRTRPQLQGPQWPPVVPFPAGPAAPPRQPEPVPADAPTSGGPSVVPLPLPVPADDEPEGAGRTRGRTAVGLAWRAALPLRPPGPQTRPAPEGLPAMPAPPLSPRRTWDDIPAEEVPFTAPQSPPAVVTTVDPSPTVRQVRHEEGPIRLVPAPAR